MSDPVEWLEHKLAQVAKVVEDEQRKVERQREYPVTLEDEPLYCYDDDYHHPLTGDPLTIIMLAEATRKLLELHRLEWNHDYAIVAADGYVTGFSSKPTRSWPVCSDCGTGDPFTPEDWPCPTLRSVAAGWGWVDE